MNRLPVWLDCDAGVDDAIALMALHELPELELLGISAVSGNAPLVRASRSSRWLWRWQYPQSVAKKVTTSARPRSCSATTVRPSSRRIVGHGTDWPITVGAACTRRTPSTQGSAQVHAAARRRPREMRGPVFTFVALRGNPGKYYISIQ